MNHKSEYDMRKIAVTGGFGFIGTNFVKYWLRKYPRDTILIMDAETYASDSTGVLSYIGANDCSARVFFEKVDIRDQAVVARVLQHHHPEVIFHFAAESHVCRSIAGPKDFMTTNIMGTWNLLEEWRQLHGGTPNRPFIHVSTDEVFGELGFLDEPFFEESPIRPRSPYAASKASSDLIALAYFETYGTQVRVTNCSNNFGPHQHHEKLLPQTFRSFLARKPAILFGSGAQMRDWLFVEDHCEAIETVFLRGENGLRYCIGGEKELTNYQFVKAVHDVMLNLGLTEGPFHVEHNVLARPTDDLRYAIDNSVIRALGWSPNPQNFVQKLSDTVRWYAEEVGFNVL